MTRKFLSLFACCLFFIQLSVAQGKHTTFFYQGKKVSSLDSADYVMVVTDPGSDTSLYSFSGYYKNGRPVIVGKASSMEPLVLEGYCLYYYPNGQKKRYVNYNKGRLDGDDYTYFPNGTLYSYIKNTLISGDAHSYTYFPIIMASNDSTGKKLVVDGNGHFIEYRGDYANIYEEGELKDGKKEGVWKSTIYGIPRDSVIELTTYKDGKRVSSENINLKEKKKQPEYVTLEHEPTYPGGMQAFYAFLGQNIKYPPNAKTNKIEGLVKVSFVVEQDGSLTNVAAADPIPDNELAAEAVRVIKLSPKWQPGMQNNKAVRVQYTVPVNFSLGVAKK